MNAADISVMAQAIVSAHEANFGARLHHDAGSVELTPQPAPGAQRSEPAYLAALQACSQLGFIAVDAETLDSLKANHQLVVTLEDGSKDGGFGERIASYYGPSSMKVLVGGIKKGLYDRYDVNQLLSDNRLLDEQIVEDIISLLK